MILSYFVLFVRSSHFNCFHKLKNSIFPSQNGEATFNCTAYGTMQGVLYHLVGTVLNDCCVEVNVVAGKMGETNEDPSVGGT